jgi:hypothetical protein
VARNSDGSLLRGGRAQRMRYVRKIGSRYERLLDRMS